MSIHDKLDNYLEQLPQIANKIKESIVEQSGKTWEALLAVYRVEAISKILEHFTKAFVLPIIVYMLYPHFHQLHQQALVMAGFDPTYNFVVLWVFLGFVSVAIFGYVAINSLIKLTNILNWVGVFKPELVIAKQVKDKLVKEEQK